MSQNAGNFFTGKIGPDYLAISGNSGTLLTIKTDGTIEIGEGLSTDEATQKVAAVLVDIYGHQITTAISAAERRAVKAEYKLARAVEALKDAEDTLRLVEHPSSIDREYGDAVEALGDRIGHGALMSSASASWRKRLSESEFPTPGGEFVAGPCRSTVVSTLANIRSILAEIGASDAD